MTAGRLLYRARQFWQALGASPQPEDLELAASVLSATQLALFESMPASEQAHALRVLRAVQQSDEQDSDLLTAALLHDVGKGLNPLRPWERALIVLAGTFCPACLGRWGRAKGEASEGDYGWRRPFVVAVQHPAWGAELAAAAGATPGAVALIRRHQEVLSPAGSRAGIALDTNEDRRLRALQAADDNS